jgi:3'(2'), 5'-bisphosphate nucleotidase
LIAESGGVCTDMWGKPLDFGVGRTLNGNEGIVAAGKETHGRAVQAVGTAVEEAGGRK